MKLRWTRFLLITLCAAMAFGGSFTCRGSSGDDDDDHQVSGSVRT